MLYGFVIFWALVAVVLGYLVYKNNRNFEPADDGYVSPYPDEPEDIFPVSSTEEEIEEMFIKKPLEGQDLIVKKEFHPNHNCVTLHFKTRIQDIDSYFSSEHSFGKGIKPGFADPIIAIEGVESFYCKEYELTVTKAECFEFDPDKIIEQVVNVMVNHMGANGAHYLPTIPAPPPRRDDWRDEMY